MAMRIKKQQTIIYKERSQIVKVFGPSRNLQEQTGVDAS